MYRMPTIWIKWLKQLGRSAVDIALAYDL